MNSQTEVLDQVVEFLKQANMVHFARPGDSAIETGFRGENNSFRIRIVVDDRPLTVVICVRIPIVIPEARRAEAAEAINRANFGLRLGRFEMDYRDGDLNFVATILLDDAVMTTGQFRFTLLSAMTHADTYSRAFGRLLYDAELSPASAIAEVEMALSDAD